MEGFDIKAVKFDSPDMEELLTGDVVKGLDPASDIQSNSEIEKDEFVQFPDGTTQKAKGDTHEDGGIKMNLPDGTKILSDNLTLTKKDVKILRDEFDIKASTSDTFATVLSKYNKKIGLHKLHEEQEEIFEVLKMQLENKDISEGTSRVNQAYVSKKIYDLEQQKLPKEKQKAEMFNVLFGMQETQKKPEKVEGEPAFKYGGVSTASFDALCKKHGMTPEEGKRMLEDGGIIVPKYDGGGIFVQDDKNLPTGANLTKEQQEGLKAYYRKHNPQLANAIDNEKVAWDSIVLNNSLINEVVQEGFLDKVQVYEQPTDRTTNYLPNAKTYGNLSSERVQGFVLKDYYENNRAINPSGKKFSEITPSEVKNLQLQYSKDLEATPILNYYSGVKGEKEVADSFFGNRTSSYVRSVVKVPGTKQGTIDVDKLFTKTPSEVNAELKDYGLTYDDIEKYKNSAYKYIKIGDDVPKVEGEQKPPVVEEPAKDPQTPPGKIEDNVKLANKRYPTMFFTPDQGVLPPSAQQAETMVSSRFQRIDPVRIGIEDTLRQLSDSREFVSEQLDTLPPTQRAAALSSLLAQTQASENEAFLKTNQTNAGYQSQAELFNIGQAEKEDTYRANNLLSYEARALTGAAKTEEEFRNYFDFNRKVALNNYETQRNLNLMNSLFPDYNLNFMGTDVNYDPNNPNWQVDTSQERMNMLALIGNQNLIS